MIWFLPYGAFILFFTGPQNLSQYPPQQESPYKLPWKGGVKRLVVQGNRSFTSHRELHHHAWDFFMMNGTQVLAVREGEVVAVEDKFDGIGLNSNFIKIKHADGNISGYFHIEHLSSLVEVGDIVKQGQPIALSGMVGQTIFPHLHFVVFNNDESKSLPISFNDVDDGVPLAGHFYISGNSEK